MVTVVHKTTGYMICYFTISHPYVIHMLENVQTMWPSKMSFRRLLPEEYGDHQHLDKRVGLWHIKGYAGSFLEYGP